MSRTRPTEVELREIEFACPKCGAEPGEWCKVTINKRSLGVQLEFVGRRAYLHGVRFELATNAGRLPL